LFYNINGNIRKEQEDSKAAQILSI